MNRSLLLIICDFLLLSLLALARFDPPMAEREGASDEYVEAVSAEAELVDILKLTLQAERVAQEELQRRLAQTEEVLGERESILTERESDLQQTMEELQQVHRAREELLAQRQMLEQEKGSMAENLLSLREQNILERERLRQAQLQIEDQQRSLESTMETVSRVQQERDRLESEKQMVMTELRVAEARQVLIAQQLENTRLEIEFERQQRDAAQRQADAAQRQTESLTEGVRVLAGTSVEIKDEIRQMQPKTPSAIFSDYRRNRVSVRFEGTFPGIFQTRNKTVEVDTVLISDTRQTYAILHTRQTPFDLNALVPTYEQMSAEIVIGGKSYRPDRILFARIDPRIVFLPISDEFVEEAEAYVYPVVFEPFRFPRAVLIDSVQQRFGESSFNVHPQFSYALEMDRRIVSQIFGEFSPSRGDLVFAQTGEFMGMMVNNQLAGLVDHVAFSDTIWLGDAFDSDRTNTIVNKLSAIVVRRQ